MKFLKHKKNFFIFLSAAALIFNSGYLLSFPVKNSRGAMLIAGNKIKYLHMFHKINTGSVIERSEGYILASEMGITDFDFYEKRYFSENQDYVKKILLKIIADIEVPESRKRLMKISQSEKNENLKKYIDFLLNGGKVDRNFIYDMDLTY
ncbi:MAG: hypothetical protein JW982_05230 [Spirochaetes bacterium]|nr:hypothetical protein [Spirochaetota bacterium]